MGTDQLSDKEIFNVARRLDSPEAVDAYLDQLCGDDATRRERILKLVAADKGDSFLEKPAVPLPETVESRVPVEREGHVIGNYKLLQKIGEGGFGVVYMAEQTSPVRRQVALKIIKPGMDTKEVIARFEAERQALAMMDHPNIAKVFDGGQTDLGHPFFVMELVKGVPLTRFCDENRLDTRDRLRLFEVVCNAIQHAHQKGVIHRDVKPSNVLVTLHDGKPVPKVIDFGVAKAISQQLTVKTLFTKYGQMVGTPQYMSPEQAEMSGLDIDTRSDIYSLGVLLYELLTGTTPIDPARFRQTGYAEMQRMIREEEPPLPSKRLSTLGERSATIASNRRSDVKALSSTVHGDLDWIVMKALDKDRNRRYETARDFALDIERYLTDAPVSACPPSTAYLLRKGLHRHRQPLMVGVSLVLLLLFGLVGTTWKWAEANAEKQKAIESKEKAEVALQGEAVARQDLQRRTESQTLSMAFDAFNSGNPIKSKSLLADLRVDGDSALSIPWRFLKQRCDEQLPMRVRVSDAQVSCLEQDPLGRGLAVGLSSGSIKLLDRAHQIAKLKSDNPLDSERGGPVRFLTYSGGGDFLTAVYGKRFEPSTVIVWKIVRHGADIVSVQESAAWIHSKEIDMTQMLRSSGAICMIDGDGTVYLWDFKENRNPDRMFDTVHNNRCGLAFSPNENVLLTYGWDGNLSCRSKDGAHLWTENLGDRIEDVSFSSCGTKAVVCGYFGTQVWDFGAADKPTRGRDLGWKRAQRCTFDDGGNLTAISSGDDASIRILDFKTGRLLEYFSNPGELRGIRDMRFRHGILLSHSPDSVHVYQPAKEGKRWINSSNYWFSAFAVTGDTQHVLFPGSSGHARHWNTETCTVTTIAMGQDQLPIRTIATSSDGSLAAISRRDAGLSDYGKAYPGVIEIWNLMDATEPLILQGHDSRILSLDYSPVDPNLLVSAGRGSEVRLWNLGSNESQVLCKQSGRPGAIVCAKFSPTGRYLVTGGNVWGEGLAEAVPAKLFRLDKDGYCKLVTDIDCYQTYDAAFSKDERYIAFCQSSGPGINLWDMETQKLLDPLLVSSPRITSVDFSPDDKCLVTASPAGEIAFLDYKTREQLGTFRVNHPLRRVKFQGNSNGLVASSMDHLMLRWEY